MTLFGYFLVCRVKFEDQEVKFAVYSFLTILIFYIFWKSYQSRYILACLPFLLVLSAHGFLTCLKKVDQSSSFVFRIIGKAVLFLFLLVSVVKVVSLNSLISFPNDLCYF